MVLPGQVSRTNQSSIPGLAGTARGRGHASSPDLLRRYPIEHLWRNVKRDKTHNRYFPTFESLIQAVEDGMRHFQAHPTAVKQVMGRYLEEQAACPLAA